MAIRPQEPTPRPLLQYLHLARGDTPPEMDLAAPYRAVLVAEADVQMPWRLLVCDWLVRTGCLYVMAWGRDCELWHDCVDECHLAMFDYGDIPDERHVMTTWHDDEPLGEVFWFCENCASGPDGDLARTIILHIAPAPKEAELLAAYRAAADV